MKELCGTVLPPTPLFKRGTPKFQNSQKEGTEQNFGCRKTKGGGKMYINLRKNPQNRTDNKFKIL